MATKYEDIISIRQGKSAYNIKDEGEKEWVSFIPNELFNSVLRTVMKSVKANNIDDHKSFWIQGTFGTGKSHAAAVITHLLCDEVNNIIEWLDGEYNDNNQALRNDVLTFRQGIPDSPNKGRRLLPVKLYGLENISHPLDLSLALQKAVKRALNSIGLETTIKTDFEVLADHVDNQNVWDFILQNDAKLSSIVSGDRNILAKKLREYDNNTLDRVKDALRNSKLDISIDNNDLAKWMCDVEQELVANGQYDGLLIVWDEFTDVMKSPDGVQIFKAMQGTVEKFANINSNSYFLLISHPSAIDPLKEGTSESSNTQVKGRFHEITYNMEPISAFHIMSRKFKVVDEELYAQRRDEFYAKHQNLEAKYAGQNSNKKEESKKDLRNLFPLHPGTAYMSTFYATSVGSHSRSVFGFLGSNDALRDFLASEDSFMLHEVITADFLWDFVEEEFKNDHAKYSPITERYNTFIAKVNEAGNRAYPAVFKAILLLNAFNNVSGDKDKGLIAPSEQNIKDLFVGTLFESELDDVLNWIHSNGIIQRSPNNFFLVQFSALPANEIEEHRKNQREIEFKTIDKVINYAKEEAHKKARYVFNKVVRLTRFDFFSIQDNASTLRSQIKKMRRDTADNVVCFALLMAKNNYELNALHSFVEQCISPDCNEPELKKVVFIVFHELMTDAQYNNFIEYRANSACAHSHGFKDQENTYDNDAKSIVNEWINKAFIQQITLYIAGIEPTSNTASNIASIINSSILPFLYKYAPEACDILRQDAPTTFWEKKNAKTLVQNILQAGSKSALEEKCIGPLNPLKKLFQESLDENLQLRPDVKSDHPVKKVCDEVSKIIAKADKSTIFNMAEKFDALRKPPYGLWTSYACMAMMAIALKPYVYKIFDMQGKARLQIGISEDISELFKVWDENKNSNKLNVKFQTPEETKLTKALAELLHLQGGKDGDTKSLNDVRFAINHDLIQEKMKLPLWSLKYASAEKMRSLGLTEINDDLRTLINNIFKICLSTEKPANELIHETLKLIEKYRIDFSSIANQKEVYADGFKNFLMSVDSAKKIEADDIAAATDFISKSMQGSIGMWEESNVNNAALKWVISTTQVQKPNEEPKDPISGVSEGANGGGATNTVTPPNVPATPPTIAKPKREKAKARIECINSLDEAKQLLIRIADLAGDNILDEINM